MLLGVRLVKWAWARARGAAWLLSCGAPIAACSASPAEFAGDPAPYVGEWTYVEPTSLDGGTPDGRVSVLCSAAPMSEPLVGLVTVEETAAGGLTLRAYDTCEIGLEVKRDFAAAKPGSACAMNVRKMQAAGTFDALTLTVHGEHLWLEAMGTATLTVGNEGFFCEKVELSGALERSPRR